MDAKEEEDIYMFYREETDVEFAMVWTRVVENGHSCDVRLECADGQYCHSHQSLLAISSQCLSEAFRYFNFNRQLPINEELVVTLPSIVTYDVLVAIIEYISIGYVSIPESRVLAFLDISRFLSIKGLKDVQLVYLNQNDNDNEMMASNPFKTQYKYVLELNDTKDWSQMDTDSSDDSDYFNEFSEDSSDCHYTPIDMFLNKPFVKRDKVLPKKKANRFMAFPKANQRRRGIQGRRPQIGSPLITEDYKFGERYQCKVCCRSYGWKKSLVRHYRVLHPNDIQLVTE